MLLYLSCIEDADKRLSKNATIKHEMKSALVSSLIRNQNLLGGGLIMAGMKSVLLLSSRNKRILIKNKTTIMKLTATKAVVIL